MRFPMRLAGLALATVLPLAAAAQGTLFRAYLSSTGSDANPCTRALPCRLLPAAIAQVEDGGEVWMLDSANYNSDVVTVDRGVTIVALPGVTGSLVAVPQALFAVTITTPAPVVFRNVDFRPLPGAETSTVFAPHASGALTLIDCHVSDFLLERDSRTGTGGNLVKTGRVGRVNVLGGTFRNLIYGIWASTSGVVRVDRATFVDVLFPFNVATGKADVSLSINETRVTGARTAAAAIHVNAADRLRVLVTNTQVAAESVHPEPTNSGLSITAQASTIANVRNVSFSGFNVGLSSTGTTGVDRLRIAGNAMGIVDGTLASAGNNAFRGNGIDFIGVTLTPATLY